MADPGTVRALYGAAQVVFAGRVAERLDPVGAARARRVIRAAGLRQIVQAAVVAVLRRRGREDGARVVGAAADLAQALVVAAGAGRSPRWGTAASLDRVVGAALAYADLSLRRRPESADPTAEDEADRDDGVVRHDNDLDVPLKRPDPFAFPAGPTVVESEVARARHRDELAVQEVVQELVATCDGRPVDEVLSWLQDALGARQLGPYPRTWLEAIARDAAAGRTYVVTKVAAEKAGIPEPLPGPPTAGVT